MGAQLPVGLISAACRAILVAMCALALAACDDEGSAVTYRPSYSDKSAVEFREYVFGVHPLHNPNRLFEVFRPMMDHLEAAIPGTRFRLEASRNYAAYEEKLYARRFHFALPNPYQTVKSLAHGYKVFAKMADDHNFRGIILVRRDSGIASVADLKGKAMSFPAPTALAATMLPQLFLKEQGLDVMKEVDVRYVGSQESAVMNVFLGNVAAAATWPPPWRLLAAERPELAEALEVRWRTETLPNNGLVARDDVEPELLGKVRGALLGMQESEEGQTILKRMDLSAFEPADDASYEPVRQFLIEFAAKVRKPE